MVHGHGAVASCGDVDQLLAGVPAECVHARAVGESGDDLARRCVDDDRRVAAAGEDAIRRAVEGDAGGPVARRDRPCGGDLPCVGIADANA